MSGKCAASPSSCVIIYGAFKILVDSGDSLVKVPFHFLNELNQHNGDVLVLFLI